MLIALSVRIIGQDRELREKRREDDRRRTVESAGRELLAALEAIKAGEIRDALEPGQRYRYPETVFVAWTEEGRLVMPWDPERDRTAGRSRELLQDAAFEPAIRACEQSELAAHRSAPAGSCYGRAALLAKNPVQAAYARWLRAQALAGAGRQAQAAELFRGLLATGPEIADENGIALRLHAAQALIRAQDARPQAIASVQSALALRPWMTSLACYLVASLAETLEHGARTEEERGAAGDLRRKAAAQQNVLEQAEALQNDFPRLRPLLQNGPRARWTAYGDDLWLVGTDGDPAANAAIFAIRGRDVFQRAGAPGILRFTDAREPAGEPLGEALSGMKVVVAQTAPSPLESGDLERRLLYLALALVATAVMFAAWLLWRDLQREMRLSELRAQFVSSVSHELKTPLTAIRMFAETLSMGRCAGPEMQAEYLSTIVSECERLSRLVDGVLLFSKAEQGKKTYRLRPVPPSEIVRDAARALEHSLAQQGFRLHVNVEKDLPPVEAERDTLEQALLNLLSNAMKFSGESRDIELSAFRRNGEAVFQVRDYGIGIAAGEHARIFEKFYRVPVRENQLIPGTGLGLALVDQIAKAHSGRVVVESAPGEGSTFSIRLPFPSEGQAQTRPASGE
jgi:two-component system, OmpR family, phosphate regulon sensor histidine kinase PhoR